MATATSELVVTSIFMGLEGAFAYSAFLPSIMTIGTFVDTEDKVVMIRKGELVGTLFLVGLSIAVSVATKSAMPLIFGLASGGLALLVYEWALRDAPVYK